METLQTIPVREFSAHVAATIQCKDEYKQPHLDAINKFCEVLPHGSGLDGKVEFQLENSNPEKLVFFLEFHHLDDNGYYCGWTSHNLIITPSLQYGFKIKITGKNFRDIKDYLMDTFMEVFSD